MANWFTNLLNRKEPQEPVAHVLDVFKLEKDIISPFEALKYEIDKSFLHETSELQYDYTKEKQELSQKGLELDAHHQAQMDIARQNHIDSLAALERVSFPQNVERSNIWQKSQAIDLEKLEQMASWLISSTDCSDFVWYLYNLSAEYICRFLADVEGIVITDVPDTWKLEMVDEILGLSVVISSAEDTCKGIFDRSLSDPLIALVCTNPVKETESDADQDWYKSVVLCLDGSIIAGNFSHLPREAKTYEEIKSNMDNDEYKRMFMNQWVPFEDDPQE